MKKRAKKHCVDCGNPIDNRSLRCRLCSVKNQWKNPRRYIIAKKAAIKRWQNPSHHEKISKIIKKTWQNPERRAIAIKKTKEQWEKLGYRELISRKAREKYRNPEEHIKTSEALKNKWKDPEFIKKHSGENNPMTGMPKEKTPNWRGGLSFLPYAPEFDAKLKEQIRIRDNYQCQLCSSKIPSSDGRKFAVHHIDYDKNNNKPENLTTLCTTCHCKTGFNRKYWISYFMETQNSYIRC